MVKKIKVGMIESHCRAVWYEPITIIVSDYPELDGMTEEEMKDYIKENFWDMKPTEEESWSETLYDELIEGDITKDKIYDEEREVFFEEVDDDDEDE
jgi:hypothetical protein